MLIDFPKELNPGEAERLYFTFDLNTVCPSISDPGNGLLFKLQENSKPVLRDKIHSYLHLKSDKFIFIFITSDFRISSIGFGDKTFIMNCIIYKRGIKECWMHSVAGAFMNKNKTFNDFRKNFKNHYYMLKSGELDSFSLNDLK